jgi:hypothetical protein
MSISCASQLSNDNRDKLRENIERGIPAEERYERSEGFLDEAWLAYTIAISRSRESFERNLHMNGYAMIEYFCRKAKEELSALPALPDEERGEKYNELAAGIKFLCDYIIVEELKQK